MRALLMINPCYTVSVFYYLIPYGFFISTILYSHGELRYDKQFLIAFIRFSFSAYPLSVSINLMYKGVYPCLAILMHMQWVYRSLKGTSSLMSVMNTESACPHFWASFPPSIINRSPQWLAGYSSSLSNPPLCAACISPRVCLLASLNDIFSRLNKKFFPMDNMEKTDIVICFHHLCCQQTRSRHSHI